MIRRRWRLLLVLTLLLLAGGLALVPGVRWPVYGWLRGEAFYRGMPSSWWAAENRDWKWTYYEAGGLGVPSVHIPFRVRPPSAWERLWWRLTGTSPARAVIEVPLEHPDAVPVLMELFEMPDDHVRRIAAHTLGRIGPAARPALDLLLEELPRLPAPAAYDPKMLDRDWLSGLLRHEVEAALREIDPEAAAWPE